MQINVNIYKSKSRKKFNLVLGTKFLPWTLDVHGKLKEELPVTTYLDALCNWRRVDDVLEIISLWITNGLYSVLYNLKKKFSYVTKLNYYNLQI